MPVVFLNFALIIINPIQIVRLHKLKFLLTVVPANVEDASVQHLLKHYSKGIKQEFELQANEYTEIFLIYDGADAVGIFVGERPEDSMIVNFDFISPKYREDSVARCLFAYLRDDGVKTIAATSSSEKYRKYLWRMSFEDDGGVFVKNL